MELFKHFNTLIWSDRFWLPPNITWEDVRNTDQVNYAQFHDLHNGFKIALPLFVMKYVLKRYIFSPIGCYLAVGTNTVKQINIDATENKVLERAFCENAKIGHKEVQGLAKQLDWSESKVERWVRHRLSRGKPSTFNTFKEEAWMFTLSLWGVCYGLYALWDKPWLGDSKECFLDYPHHDVTSDVWWYYIIELGFYWQMTISLFTDTKRKDFLYVLVHHIVTILLLTISWTCNLFRIGSLVLVIYEFTGASLHAAKIAKCLQNHRFANACYTVFTVVCIFPRLVLYPYRITYYTVYESLKILPDYPPVLYYVFNSLLFALQIMHVVWSWMIVKTALRAVSPKNTEVKVLRRDSDESNDRSSDHKADAKGTSNGRLSQRRF